MPIKGESVYLPYKEQIQKWREEGLSIRGVVAELEKQGLDASFTGVRYFLVEHLGNSNTNTFEAKLEEEGFTPPENWSHGWLKTKQASIFIKNDKGLMPIEDVSEVIKRAANGIKELRLPEIKSDNEKALRAVISDAHVGMKSDSRDAMFSFEYNEDVFKKHLSVLFNSMKSRIDAHGTFDQIIIDDLGDGLDGFDGETTRGGHKLPQNMDNKGAWEAYVSGKLETYVAIIKLNAARHYVFRNVTNCNHSGDFGWTANIAIKMVIEKMFPIVEYLLLDRPIEHFFYGDHCFMLTHGKDKALMVRNWPIHLTDKISNIVRQYIDHHDIRSRFIHLDKGDLHQSGYAREPKFDYRNFMSFAPPSTWVQSNFGVSYCGFSLQVIPKYSNQIEHTDIFFDMKKV